MFGYQKLRLIVAGTIFVLFPCTALTQSSHTQDTPSTNDMDQQVAQIIETTIEEIKNRLDDRRPGANGIMDQLEIENQLLTQLENLIEIRDDRKRIVSQARTIAEKQNKLMQSLKSKLADVRRQRRALLLKYKKLKSTTSEAEQRASERRKKSSPTVARYTGRQQNQIAQSENVTAFTRNTISQNQIRTLKPSIAPVQYGLLIRFVLPCGCKGEVYRHHNEQQLCLHHHHRNRPMTTHKLQVWSGKLPNDAIRIAVLADGKTVFWTNSLGYSIATGLQIGS